MSDEAVETERLRLRRPRIADALALSELMTPEISRWLAAWPSPLTHDMAAARIVSGLERRAAGDAFPYLVERRSDAAVLGWIALNRDPEHKRTAMLGFWLGAAHHGQGYMREAVRAAIASAFAHFDVDRIEAGAQPENAPSLAVLVACGMTPIGERMVFAETRGRDEVCDFYALSRTPR